MSEPVHLTHAEIEELLGAYALDAVEPDEREAIELHLRDCPRCRAEVAEHREVASLLGHAGAPAPEGVWDRILGELEPAPPAMRVAVVPDAPAAPAEPPAAPPAEPTRGSSSAAVVPLDARRRSIPVRTFVVVTGVAAALVAFLGITYARQSQRLDHMQNALDQVSLDRVAKNASIDPAVSATLTSADHRYSAKAVVTRDGRGYLLGDLPAERSGRTYQLWGKVDGTVLSLGTFDGRSDVVQFQVQKAQLKAVAAFMVTDEKAPGVAASTQKPVVIGTV